MIELFSGSIVQRYLFQLPFCFVKIEQLNIFYRNCYETKYARRNKNALQAFQLLEDLLSQSAIFDIIKNELLLIFSSRHFSYWFFCVCFLLRFLFQFSMNYFLQLITIVAVVASLFQYLLEIQLNLILILVSFSFFLLLLNRKTTHSYLCSMLKSFFI